MSGIAVNSLGHCHKGVLKVLSRQSKKLWHVSNLFYTQIMKECAQTICNASGMEKVFFSNSGSEAMETAIKMMRKFFQEKGENRFEIITMKESFHGRSIANISASQEISYTKNFYPLLGGFVQVDYGDINALKNAINERTAGIILEPIQGEGGLNFAGWDYIRQVSKIARDAGVLLTLDEVQCGASRTGKFNAFHWAGIEPDIVAMAKGIGGGFPIGATLFAKSTADVITVGSHGTTFGGNCLAVAVANFVCETLSEEKFLGKINDIAKYLHLNLVQLQSDFPHIIKEIRGFGLMTGFMFHEKYEVKAIVEKIVAKKLLVISARNNVLRLLPPLIVEKKHIDEACKVMASVFKSL
jgi:acetylornithine/N-succinyldiaminopimelate aminotransferase